MKCRPSRLNTSSALSLASLLLITLISFTACQKDAGGIPEGKDHNVTLRFKAVVGGDSIPLKFGDNYENTWGESYSVKAFKFYIHGIELINTDSGKTYQANTDEYFLVDFADSLSTVLKLGVFPFKYNRIAFTVGIDSTHNVSGAQTGSLDPVKGMFWNWNTGYIMAKLEGTSPVSTGPNHEFKFHIGGFRTGQNALRRVLMLFPYKEQVDMKSGKTTDITITADVNDWFHTPHDFKIKGPVNSIMTPGQDAVWVSENYSKMFTVLKISNDGM